MRQTTNLQIQKAAMLKAARSAIRLKHSLRADREIAEELPVLEATIDEALAGGTHFELDPGRVYLVES